LIDHMTIFYNAETQMFLFLSIETNFDDMLDQDNHIMIDGRMSIYLSIDIYLDL
jgi:hypothetical protein